MLTTSSACYMFAPLLSFQLNLPFFFFFVKKYTDNVTTRERSKSAFRTIQMRLHNNTFTVRETFETYEYLWILCTYSWDVIHKILTERYLDSFKGKNFLRAKFFHFKCCRKCKEGLKNNYEWSTSSFSQL